MTFLFVDVDFFTVVFSRGNLSNQQLKPNPIYTYISDIYDL